MQFKHLVGEFSHFAIPHVVVVLSVFHNDLVLLVSHLPLGIGIVLVHGPESLCLRHQMQILPHAQSPQRLSMALPNVMSFSALSQRYRLYLPVSQNSQRRPVNPQRLP